MSGNGLRYNEGKAELTYNLLGREVAQLEAAVWAAGAKKYAAGNWLKGASLVGSLNSLIRHATALLNGEDIDPESGLHHAGHLICSAKIVAQSCLTRPDLDDRPSTLVKGDESV